MSAKPPFVVFALPRSRTFWLSRYLTYGGWNCAHDEARHARSLDDIKTWLSLPSIGCVETSAAPFWRLLRTYRPDATVVTVRRPARDVIDSLNATGVQFDQTKLAKGLESYERNLDAIERRWPGALSVGYTELATESGCKAIFERCLPFAHDSAWWARASAVNMQYDLAASVRYARAYAAPLAKVAGQAKRVMLRGMQPVVCSLHDMIIQQEPGEQFLEGARDLFKDHFVATDQEVGALAKKNVAVMLELNRRDRLMVTTARCNGRMFGYLVTVHGPSLDQAEYQSALHTAFYASPEAPGLGRMLRQHADAALAERGVGEVFVKSGIRGTGPRLAAIYKRQGGEFMGEIYRHELKAG